MIVLKDIITNNRERNYSQIFKEFGSGIARNSIVPGHYFSFNIEVPNISREWIPNSKEEYKAEPAKYITSKPYYDLNPTGLVLYHNKWKDNLIMINLKVIPPKYHPTIINAHLNIIESSLDKIGGIEGDLVPIEERLKMNLPMYGITSKIISQSTGINLNESICAYKLDMVKSASMLDWNNIGELPMSLVDTSGMVLASSAYNVNRIYDLFDLKQN
mgnify:FL=1|tara:strand:+ start:145 stop:792 length:648 start_codon:yes stop_codon:yes gene_type:complete